MGRILNIKMFEKPVSEVWDDDTCSSQYFYLENDQIANPYEYDHYIYNGVDLGSIGSEFYGTKEQLIEEIEDMVNDKENSYYRNFEAIGHLSIIVNKMDEYDYDFIIIRNM